MPYKDPQSPEAKASQAKRNKAYYEKTKNKKVEHIIPETKVCPTCKKEKWWTEFYPRKNRKNGLTSWCKKCLKEYSDKYAERNRETRRLREFGLKPNEYQKMYDKQNGRCAICNVKKEDAWKKTLCIDHCHVTGKIRGLLCHDCNVGLGRFKDNIDGLRNAIKYLSN